MMLLQRAATMPCRAMSSTLAAATRAGAGVRRFSSANGVTMGSPNASTNRQAMVVAAFTVTCWPRIARRPSLESVEGAGHSQAGVRLDGRCQTRVLAQMFRDQVGPRVEIEQRPDAAEQRRQHGRQAVRELDHQRVLLLRLRHPDPALRLSQLHGPGIRAVRHVLDAFERAGRQKGEDALPVVRRTIRELQGRRLALGDRRDVFGRLLAETRRRHPIAPVERVVEPAQAREAAGEGDLGDGQRRFGQELFGQQQPAGQQQLDRRRRPAPSGRCGESAAS